MYLDTRGTRRPDCGDRLVRLYLDYERSLPVRISRHVLTSRNLTNWRNAYSAVNLRVKHLLKFGDMNLTHSRSTGNVLSLQKFYQQKSQTSSHVLRKSHSTANCVIISKRGFKPSDIRDPLKREFLTNLTQKIWHLVRIIHNFLFVLEIA